MKRIEGVGNERVREAVGLRRGPLWRGGTAAFVIEGPHLLEEALGAAGVRLRRVFMTRRFMTKHGALGRRAAEAADEVLEAAEKVMERLAGTESPQGVVAVAEYRPAALGETDLGGVTVVLDGVSDPGNTGTLIRTADAAGARAVVVLAGSCDPFNGKSLRASAGSVFHLPVAAGVGRAALVRAIRRAGARICVTEPSGGTSIYEADLTGGVAIVLGNEAHGVSEEIRRSADLRLSIPIEGRAESLNVTAAAAVLLYECLRRRLPRHPLETIAIKSPHPPFC